MISVKNITKRFAQFTAVNRLSFDVNPGDVVGFLGPNGAGKSTSMKMITGFLPPDSGEVLVNGQSVTTSPQEVQQQIGYLPEGAPAYGDMTVLAFLNFIAEVRQIDAQLKSHRIADVVAKVELSAVLDKPIETLSKGFKRRVGLAQALIHDPAILILDEPTDGLDPNQKHQVRNLIKNLAKDKIVIISTHILEEVTAVCNRVVIISDGEKCFDDTPQALLQKSRYYRAINLTLDKAVTGSVSELLPGGVQWEAGASENNLILFPGAQTIQLHELENLFEGQGYQVQQMHIEAGRLDEVFRTITLKEAS
ncbi:ABC transporter ATP-binding protein [Planctobacterium marinum]|uniref:ABC transporter ATP-binding protein n=1 Tax=Planctobacterium marinum TaxID=1631968 RepID=A0AA48KRH1_9ALTE|nr:ABC transporter ATP-binding protein [Planctobacterium marinum]